MQAGAVVALVREAVDDELVVVNAVVLGLVVARLLRLLEVADVPEVGDRIAVGGGAVAIVLIVLVVEYEELLPGGVGNPPLVGVLSYVSTYVPKSEKYAYRSLPRS